LYRSLTLSAWRSDVTVDRPSGSRAVALALLLVASVTLAGVGAAQSQDDASPADAVYVSEDGDAVLVYSNASEGSQQLSYGVDVESGLAYATVTDPSAGGGLRANLTGSATRTSLRADGRLAVDRPPSLTGLDVDVASRTNDSVSRADATLDLTLSGGNGFARLVEAASTTGNVTATASRLHATGRLDADLAAPLVGTSSYEARLSESADGDGSVYTLRVDENRTVREPAVGNWQNRSAARRTLERQQGALARALGGDASVTVESHDFDAATGAGSPRLDLAYTVTFRGVDAGIEAAVRSDMASSPGVNRSQADRVASAMTNVTVEELAVRYETTGQGVSGSFSIDVSNYDGLALAYLDAAGSMENGTGAFYAGGVEQARTELAAQQAAGLEQRLEWSGSLGHPDGESTRLRFGYHERTHNRSAYVDALDERGVSTYNSSLALSGTLDNDSVVMNGSAETSGDGLFEGFVGAMGNGSSLDDNATAVLDALGRADPQKAKFHARTGSDGLTVETGVAVADMGAFVDTLASEQGLPGFTGAVGRTSDGETRSYVRLDGALSPGASEDDVRSLSAVDDSTTVHMPGEWDREFPTMDTDRAEAFLGPVPGREDAGGTGFGAAAGVAGVLGAGLLAGRS
jgi:hypothetical protein